MKFFHHYLNFREYKYNLTYSLPALRGLKGQLLYAATVWILGISGGAKIWLRHLSGELAEYVSVLYMELKWGPKKRHLVPPLLAKCLAFSFKVGGADYIVQVLEGQMSDSLTDRPGGEKFKL